MLRLVTGPFHPTLESTLVQDLLALKAQDPSAALALVVPSDQLRRFLKQLLALKHGLTLLNVHILSFHQLALHLDHERRIYGETSDTERRINLVTDIFFEHLLRHLGQRNVPQTEALCLSRLASGAWTALWASLRDLKDAMVDPAVGLRAVEEGQFAAVDREKLKGLLTLYAALREGGRALGVGSPDDLAALVTDFVPASPFLRGLTRLCYYGSYDLTQTQLTLLEAVSRSYPVTAYFPLDDSPAYGFARQFLERHLYPLTGGSGAVLSALSGGAAVRRHKAEVSVEVRNAAGAEDELTLVCKQILSLVETNGYRFDEIGVVGRTLLPYRTALKQTFDRHRIPFISNATFPLMQEPVVKTLLHLAQLKGNGFYRPAMMEVVTSPWNRRVTSNIGPIDPRPDLWRSAVQVLAITRGEAEWRRLTQLGRLETWNSDDDEASTEHLGSLSIDGGQLHLLWDCIAELIDGVKGLPENGGYGDLTDAFLSLAEQHLTIPLPVSQSFDRPSNQDDARDVSEALGEVFTQLRDLDRLGLSITWEEWTETFMQVLERTTCAMAPSSHRGVQVLDAMAARGLGFRALFVIGMNEKLFPRFIHEDGFLRDRHRLVLSETLGYKIDQKLQAYGEEALLFELLRSSAGERLYLSYQRADDAGRALAPSTYLDRIGGQSHTAGPEAAVALPRRWLDRTALSLFAPPLLTREELTVSRVLQGRDVSSLLDSVGRDGLLFSHGLEAQGAIESEQTALNAYDGILDDSSAHWSAVSRRGFSPTALETYARCPFQYFSAQVLALKPIRSVVSMELSPPAMGQLCHDALRLCYRTLIERGWPMAMLSSNAILEETSRAVAQAFAAYATTHGTGYHLTWQLAQQAVRRVVEATIVSDCETASATGFLPVGFEVDVRGVLPQGPGQETVPLRGRWDRLDRHPASGALRVVDYKYRANGRVEPKDRNLLQAALRGIRLQPALYSVMAPDSSHGEPPGPLPEQVDFLYLLPEGSPTVERASFTASAWQGPSGPILTHTVQVLVEGVHSGQHVILPDAYCDHCEFSIACRRTHQPSWWRAYRSSQVGELRRVRSLKEARG
ncbi:MAG: ATP-dependent helicase/nuclease AddAB, subunit B [Nitrospira sp.]|jgi:ATP-dependent helicase/nuclease subunit B|nr:MAG: ATP-dependent helicase/nuclease AddAB, subunit B [Nitrospira sp.]